MSTDVEKLRKLKIVHAGVRFLELRTRRTAAARNEMIREMRADGISVLAIADATKMTRARIYKIVDEPDPDLPAAEYRAYVAHLDELYAAALLAWEKNGEAGNVEDFVELPEVTGAR